MRGAEKTQFTKVDWHFKRLLFFAEKVQERKRISLNSGELPIFDPMWLIGSTP